MDLWVQVQKIEDIRFQKNISSGHANEKNYDFVVLDVAKLSRLHCAFSQKMSPQYCPLVFLFKNNMYRDRKSVV